MTESNIDPMADIDEIQEKARQTFSLRDRLRGIQTRTAKELVYLDVEAVVLYAQQKAKVDQLRDQLVRLERGFERQSELPADAPRPISATDVMNAENDLGQLVLDLEEIQERMLVNALSIHMRALPQVVLDVATREAKKKFRSAVTKRIEDEQVEEYNLYLDQLCLVESIEKVVDATGAEDTNIDFDAVVDLCNLLGPSQVYRLRQAFKELTFIDGVERAAVEDPGF